MARRRLIQVSVGVLLFALIAAVVTPHLFSQSSMTSPGMSCSGGVYPDPRARFADPAEPSKHHELRPLGTWERNVGPVHITLTFTPEHMEGRVVCNSKDEGKFAVDFQADYSVTRDSILYGVVTSAGLTEGKIRMEAEELIKLHSILAAELLDQPFSMRCRVDGDVLTVKDIRFYVKSEKEGELKGNGEQIAVVGRGRYTRKAATPTARAQ
jgi:hypothetical protein